MRSRDILLLSMFTLVTVVAWVAFGVYHASVTSHITSVQQEFIEPLEPTFDYSIVEQLKQP